VLYGTGSPETFQLYQVSTSIVSLTNGTGGVSAYLDLGGGTVYGSRIISTADNGTYVSITLNSSFIGDAQNAVGSSIALGGRITTAFTFSASENAFRFSESRPLSDTQLILTTQDASSAVPEAGTALLFLGGLAALGAMRRRLHGTGGRQK